MDAIATQADADAAQTSLGNVRVSVAAEVASTYYSLSTCYQLLDVARKDAASRQETARLADISAKAGFTAPSVAALARASAADGSSRISNQDYALALIDEVVAPAHHRERFTVGY